jgi:hypothetical protein
MGWPFPAAQKTIVPSPPRPKVTALSMAVAMTAGMGVSMPVPSVGPHELLMTAAPFVTPKSRASASVASLVPSIRSGMMEQPGQAPTTPMLLAGAAASPETEVPWLEPPGLGLLSPPMKSQPGTIASARSGWSRSIPLSITAMMMLASPSARSKAGTAAMSLPATPLFWPVFSRCHWSGNLGSSGT